MIHTFSFPFLFNNLYLTYNPLEYSTNWKSGEGLITQQGRAGMVNWIHNYQLGIYLYKSLNLYKQTENEKK